MLRSTITRAGSAIVAFGLFASDTKAQQADTLPRPALVAVERTEPVHIDARLEEAVWKLAQPATGFIQREPNPGLPASQKTEVRVLVDEAAIYIGARLFDAEPDSIAAQLGRRDDTDVYADYFHVAIDSYADRRTAFRFSITPSGVQTDAFHFADNNDDSNWDAVWESATSVDSTGWTAELRIPLSQLRFGSSRGVERRWGIQFAREIARRGEESYWSPTPPTQSGMVSRFGDLRGLEAIAPPARLEFLPYASTQLSRRASGIDNPLVDATETNMRVGADVRYGLPGGFTLTGTINPDFGQVEADAAVVNLTAFETFFDERRPFFLEGGDIFRFGSVVTLRGIDSPQPFYSRRIGRRPRLSVQADDAVYTEEPSQTDILGAAKISGKSQSGWSLGLLGARTNREEAVFRRQDGTDGRATVEPQSDYFVGRLSRDFREGNTVLGIASTATRRARGTEFDPFIARNTLSGAFTAEHSWNDRDWVVSGYVSGSRVAGDNEYISALQRSNTHLLQRPDRNDRHVNDQLDRLQGHHFAASMAKMGGGHWRGSLTYGETSPGYDVNEIGFQERSDVRAMSAVVQYQDNTPGRWARSWDMELAGSQDYNFDGDQIQNTLSLSNRTEWTNFWEIFASGDVDLPTFDDRLTRGGPLARRPLGYSFEVSLESDGRKSVSAEVEYEYRGSRANEWSHEYSLELNWRPTSAISLGLGGSYSRELDTDQYVTSTLDAFASETYGSRYVFGDIEQHELEMDLRIDWIFSPTLSLEAYLEPLISSGRFHRYKQLTRARSRDYEVYGSDAGTITRDQNSGTVTVDPDAGGPAAAFQFRDRDFTVRALRGNAVLRWEFRPGSALYLVWQQQREEEADVADLTAARRPFEAFRVPAENVLLFKISYWIGR